MCDSCLITDAQTPPSQAPIDGHTRAKHNLPMFFLLPTIYNKNIITVDVKMKGCIAVHVKRHN